MEASSTQKVFSSLNGLAFKLMMLLSFTTLFQPYEPFGPVNRILVFAIIAVLLISFFLTRYHPAYWLALLALVGLVVYNLIISTGEFATTNDPVYLPFWFLILMVFSENNRFINELIVKNFVFIRAITIAWCLFVGISIFFPFSYVTSWGGGMYFGSIPQSIWRLAPCACLIQTTLLICLAYDHENKNKYLLCSFVPLYCGFMGGSRTYFIVICLFFVLFLYYYSKNTSQFRLLLIVMILMGLVAIGFTGIGAKIFATQYTQNSFFDFWGTVTNGRSDIWQSDLAYFLNADLPKQIFGSGFDKIYEVNLSSKLGAAVYAHNDFINVLIANGVVGLALYLIPLIAMFHTFSKEYRGGKIIMFLCVLIWITNATLNMTYTYTVAVIALAVLPRAICACDARRTPLLSVVLKNEKSSLSANQNGTTEIVRVRKFKESKGESHVSC